MNTRRGKMPEFTIELSEKDVKVLQKLVDLGFYKTPEEAFQVLVKQMLEEVNTFRNIENETVIDEIIENLMAIKKGVKLVNP